MNQTPLIHPISGQINIARLAEEITNIRNRLVDASEKLLEENPHYNREIDIRITCFAKYQNVLNSFQLGCGFWGINLLNPAWLTEYTTYTEKDYPVLRLEFQGFLKLGLVHFSFSAIESSFRAYIRHLDPTAHNGATSEFKRIYTDLLENRLSCKKPQWVELLDMFSKLRNIIHNNGVFINKLHQDSDQIYKGITYKFYSGKPVDSITWPLIIEIISDAADMLVDIANDPTIKSSSGDIVDLSATVARSI